MMAPTINQHNPLLEELLENMTVTAHSDIDGIRVNGIVFDSREVQPGNLFVALVGDHTDGHEYIGQALDRGSAAVIVERPWESGCWVQVPDTLRALAEISSALYRSPANDLVMCGVTGSNGKSTTTYILEHIFEQVGLATGLVGTIEYRWGNHHIPAPHTTPFSSDLNRFLAAMRDDSISHVVMEVSSHALMLKRIHQIQFDVTAFTNLSHEHLDFHKTMEAYAAAKFRLFAEHRKHGGAAVLNYDDAWAQQWIPQLSDGKTITYGFDQHADIYPEQHVFSANGTKVRLHTPAGTMNCETNLLGRHNLYNLMTAMGMAIALEISPKQIEQALETPVVVPGRLQSVDMDQPFRVLVDYAHTPDGLEKVLETLAELPHRNLYCVVGAGGDRDTGKRPKMAAIGQRYADRLVLTSDNPRTENPERILDEMVAGCRGTCGEDYQRIADRRSAITAVITQAGPEDIVLIAGKGHEEYQEINGVRHHFSDVEEVEKALVQAGYPHSAASNTENTPKASPSQRGNHDRQ